MGACMLVVVWVSCAVFVSFYLGVVFDQYQVRTAVLRATIVNRTYGIHKNLYISTFLLTIFGPINYQVWYT